MKKIKPLIMAHKGGDFFGEENSLKAVRKSLEYGAEIIELDVRKSADDILFCYHGNFLEFLFPKLFFKKNFKDLEMNHSSISNLKDIANEIGSKRYLFLDIKDESILLDEIKNTLKGIPLKEIYIAHRNENYLKGLGKFPENWKKVINMGYFFSTSKIKKLKEIGICAVELFPWNFNKKNILELRKNNIDVAIPRIFRTKTNYSKNCILNQTLWITGFNLPKIISYVKRYRD